MDEKRGRPEGLRPAGVEENLWQIWNWWLIREGWLPSAEPGQSIIYKYINYPLSQALLREGDKERLERRFREEEKTGKLSRTWDRDKLGTWLRGYSLQFSSKYLRELIMESDPRRYEAIVDAVYEVYISIDWDQEISQTRRIGRLTTQRRLMAGLYRIEDPIMGTCDYYLYPRQPKRWRGGNLEVIRDAKSYPLREDRPGWCLPLWPELPSGGISYEVRGDTQIKELVLPERGFWLLVRDPENEESGVFASWGHPGLGETFLLLCRKEYDEQMEIFRQEDLLKWDHIFSIDDEWVEYRECMILSPSWDGVIPQREDLYDALKPTVSATISLKGGLRAPRQGGWLEGYEPEVTIVAFDDSVELKVLDVSCPDETIMNEIVNTNQIICLPSLNPGNYLVEARIAGKLAVQRTLRILSWDAIDCAQPEYPFDVKVGTFALRGAVIKVNEVEDNGEE
jgi:hypothetical protein